MSVIQYLVVATAIIIIVWQIRKIYLRNSGFKDVWWIIFFSFLVGAIALFPALVTTKLARLLNFESNINAIIFVLLGILFAGALRLYELYRIQQKDISRLNHEIALLKAEKENTIP